MRALCAIVVVRHASVRVWCVVCCHHHPYHHGHWWVWVCRHRHCDRHRHHHGAWMVSLSHRCCYCCHRRLSPMTWHLCHLDVVPPCCRHHHQRVVVCFCCCMSSPSPHLRCEPRRQLHAHTHAHAHTYPRTIGTSEMAR